MFVEYEMKTEDILILLGIGAVGLYWLYKNRRPDCDLSTGFTWCEQKQKCIQSWIEECRAPYPIDGQTDEHGCFTIDGYRWCESKQKCIHPKVESC